MRSMQQQSTKNFIFYYFWARFNQYALYLGDNIISPQLSFYVDWEKVKSLNIASGFKIRNEVENN